MVKICGVTRPEDARLAVELGADLVGLNFWPGSPRHVELAAVHEIVAAVERRAKLVGVFVNEAPGRIDELHAELGLALVQLHGDEPEAELRRHAPRLLRVERADRLRPAEDAGQGGGSLRQGDGALPSRLPALFLIDAPRDARYGGTGVGWEWGTARSWVAACPRPVLVAGGIRAGTARSALEASGAAGLDVASGVESAPGVKDAEKMKRLFEEVRRAAT